MFGSNWLDEEPSEESKEKFKSITGEDFHGSKDELEKRIERIKESGFTSRGEDSALNDLLHDLTKE